MYLMFFASEVAQYCAASDHILHVIMLELKIKNYSCTADGMYNCTCSSSYIRIFTIFLIDGHFINAFVKMNARK